MRISDWSSDVCSSDLVDVVHRAVELVGTRLGHGIDRGADGIGGDVVIGDLDVVGGDGIHRDRAAGVGHAVAVQAEGVALGQAIRSEEHTSELQSLMRISYAVFCLKKKLQTHDKTANPP